MGELGSGGGVGDFSEKLRHCSLWPLAAGVGGVAWRLMRGSQTEAATGETIRKGRGSHNYATNGWG